MAHYCLVPPHTALPMRWPSRFGQQGPAFLSATKVTAASFSPLQLPHWWQLGDLNCMAMPIQARQPSHVNADRPRESRSSGAGYNPCAPATAMAWPVTQDASGEARNSATFAISSAWPMRPNGIEASVVL